MAQFDEWEQSLAAEIAEESEDELPPLVEPSRERSEAVEQIRLLCRVCSSNGLISISTNMASVNLQVKTSSAPDHPEWRVTIAKIIAEVSGTDVCKFGFCSFFNGDFFCCEIP